MNKRKSSMKNAGHSKPTTDSWTFLCLYIFTLFILDAASDFYFWPKMQFHSWHRKFFAILYLGTNCMVPFLVDVLLLKWGRKLDGFQKNVLTRVLGLVGALVLFKFVYGDILVNRFMPRPPPCRGSDYSYDFLGTSLGLFVVQLLPVLIAAIIFWTISNTGKPKVRGSRKHR